MIQTYSKHMERDDKTRIRLERQEYPRKSLADHVMDKLSSSQRLKEIGKDPVVEDQENLLVILLYLTVLNH